MKWCRLPARATRSVPKARLAPEQEGKISDNDFVINTERPVQPAQLFADFAPFVAVLQSSGDRRANPASPLIGGAGCVVKWPGIGLCFHVYKYDCGIWRVGGVKDPPPTLRLP